MLRARWLPWISLLFFPSIARPQPARPDSLAVLHAAHSAQNSFERLRRHYIPAVSGGEDRPCETEIGRMCYWQDDNSDRPVSEPRETTRARRSLVATLTRLSALSPGDDWIAGQRIRYMVESGDDSGAVSAARECAPPRWYCRALEGYALHESERYAEATAAFDSALAEMPVAERCRWNDISALLDDADRDNYERIPCGQRDSVEKRFWKLARPSFVVSGNDRRTEHFSRVLLADLSENAANAYDLRWGPDMRELLIRYGAPSWYTTALPTPLDETPPPVGHDRAPSFHFAADMDGDSIHWDAYAPIARERYAPPYMDSVAQLDVQFAMLKRGDSALVVAVYSDPASDSARSEALLGVSGDLADSVPPDSAEGRIRRARAAWKGMMVAMETFDPTLRRDARARAWLEPPPHARGAPDVSTLLLFAPDSATPAETLDNALDHALTDDDLRGTRRLGLYWEVYGAAPRSEANTGPPADSTVTRGSTPDDSSSVLVTVVRTDGGIMRWFGKAIHLTPGDSPLTVRWHDARPATGIETHSVVLDLSTLAKGTYRVSVAVGSDPAHRTEVSREIKLR